MTKFTAIPELTHTKVNTKFNKKNKIKVVKEEKSRLMFT